jgi:hypothetical protein
MPKRDNFELAMFTLIDPRVGDMGTKAKNGFFYHFGPDFDEFCFFYHMQSVW